MIEKTITILETKKPKKPKTWTFGFLADRTIGRAFGTACRLSVVCDVLYPGKTAGPICMKFSGKVWTDHGTT